MSAIIEQGSTDRSSPAAGRMLLLFGAARKIDQLFTTATLIGIYLLNLFGTALINWCYWEWYWRSEPDFIEQVWFRAAIIDNYTFTAILVYPLLIAYLQLTEDIDERFCDMIVLLAGRRILQAVRVVDGKQHLVPLRMRSTESQRELNRIEVASRRLGQQAGLALLLLLALILVGLGVDAFMSSPDNIPRWFFISLAVLHLPLALPLAYKAGDRLTRLVSYGVTAYRHRRHDVVPVPMLGHSDQAGGLKPLGDFFLGQTYRICLISGYLIAAAVFFVASSPLEEIMIPKVEGLHEQLTWVFIGLALLVVAMQLAGVVLPLWTVHKRMIAYKRSLIDRAAIMTRRQHRLLQDRAQAEAVGRSPDGEETKLASVERWIDNYDALPVWPIPFKNFRIFWVVWSSALTTAIGPLIKKILP